MRSRLRVEDHAIALPCHPERNQDVVQERVSRDRLKQRAPERCHRARDADRGVNVAFPAANGRLIAPVEASSLRARLRALGHSSDRVIKLSVFERLADVMDERFFAWDEGPLLILDTTGGDVEQPGRLDETIDLIRKTRAGVQYVRLG